MATSAQQSSTTGQIPFGPASQPLSFFHIAAELGAQAPIGLGTRGGGTLLGSVIVNAGGTFSLVLYNGSGSHAPVVAAITNPATGAVFPFGCVVDQGLTCTYTGTPGDITVTYADLGGKQ